jgi:DNA-binding response OmpR family regulator
VEGGGRERDTILLVEDNEDIAVVYGEILRTIGYEAITVGDGRSALAVLDDPTRTVSLVLTDLAMPHMSGAEVVHAMRARGLRTPVIMLSGYPAPPGDPVRAEVDAWLQKPLEVDELVAMVARVLRAHRADRDQ